MPDADDFDVEYFRSLLSGGAEKKSPAAEPAAKPRLSGAPKKRAAGAGAVTRKKAASPARRKKP
jgi:hypothetical protein